jgi:hypothetical protein
MPSSLNVIRVNTRSRSLTDIALLGLLLARVVDVLEVESVDVAGEISKKRQADVDEKVGAAAANEEYSYGRDWVSLLVYVTGEAVEYIVCNLLKNVMITRKMAEIIASSDELVDVRWSGLEVAILLSVESSLLMEGRLWKCVECR